MIKSSSSPSLVDLDCRPLSQRPFGKRNLQAQPRVRTSFGGGQNPSALPPLFPSIAANTAEVPQVEHYTTSKASRTSTQGKMASYIMLTPTDLAIHSQDDRISTDILIESISPTAVQGSLFTHMSTGTNSYGLHQLEHDVQQVADKWGDWVRRIRRQHRIRQVQAALTVVSLPHPVDLS